MNANKKLKVIKLALVLGALFFLFLKSASFKETSAPEIPPPSVTVQKPQLQEMVDYVTQTGSVVAYNSVNLVARVAGYLEKNEFIDGSFVKKGQELFVIQPQPYMEQLKAAKSTVAVQKAEDVYNKSEYARQKRMYKQNATSLNEVEKWLAKTQEIESSIDRATADEVNAEITYSYTHVHAPFDGRIGRHLVDVGNLVGNGEATKLATIDQIDPLYVYFNLNELDLIKLREAARARGFDPKDINQIPVQVSMQTDPDTSYQATLDFVNTGLNAATGTMELRAILKNKDHLFLPGLFVQVKLAITKPEKQLTVPDTSVLHDQIGTYLLVVDENNKVVLKRVRLGSLEQGMRAVVKGLEAQDMVVIDGMQNATPGNKVVPHVQTVSSK